MPGPAVHYIVGKKLREQYPFIIDYGEGPRREKFLFSQNIRNQMDENRTHLNFGTLGPDFLFFNIKDWPQGNLLPVRKMIRFAEIQKSLEAKVEESFPILIRIKELKDQLGERLLEEVRNSPLLSAIKQLLEDVKAILELMTGIVNQGIEDLVTSNIDIYGFLKSPLQNCEAKENWWWFDILHYNKSGQFSQYLLENSRDNPALHSYAIGYLSHFAADAVGHPYVNNIVRGPYRTHSQRHSVVEKFQDVSAFLKFDNLDFNTSELHDKYKFTEAVYDIFSGERINEVDSIIDSLTPGITDVGLPEDLANLFSEATKEVYKQNGEHLFGGGMEPAEVDAAYRLWYSWFKSSTSEAILPDSLPDLPPLSEDLRGVWEDFKNRFNNALSEFDDAVEDLFSSNGSTFSWDSLVNLFKKLERVIKAAAAAAAAAIEAIEDSIATISTHSTHWILNQIYQALYSIYDYFRLSVSLNGLAFPSPRYLNDLRVQHMLNPQTRDIRGNILNNNWGFPLKKMDVGEGIWRVAPQESHLVYPSPLNIEQEATTPSPVSYSQEPHTYYIDQDLGISLPFIRNIAPITDFNNHNSITKGELMGNAVELTGALYDLYNKGETIPNINLDADRGIGYPCWEASGCVNDNIKEPVNLKFNT
ncbi:zinc dependent phospholipase C family protein [Salinimicrobium sediminilitoris]|uniref:zinc dependent phospholipase C family protein n=1 Tax=Salinimicrobium sediminilitoris TaxID=2876715 RepID=UPI001E3CF538|nr:zinc dependent phospholipase C family protein [Salinimicrobium sediminilitoris]MCC8358379.1 zinc dependent phospholipase C family protein [Salinimicrobium sediminilitoris]